MYLLVNSMSSLKKKCLFKSFVHFKLFVILLLSCKSSLNILLILLKKKRVREGRKKDIFRRGSSMELYADVNSQFCCLIQEESLSQGKGTKSY